MGRCDVLSYYFKISSEFASHRYDTLTELCQSVFRNFKAQLKCHTFYLFLVLNQCIVINCVFGCLLENASKTLFFVKSMGFFFNPDTAVFCAGMAE